MDEGTTAKDIRLSGEADLELARGGHFAYVVNDQ
jgi:hypothetical protein